MKCFWDVFCQIWSAIGEHLARHAEGYGLGAGAFGIAVVKNWPPLVPKTIQDWWTWARGSAQTALPVSRTPNPIPPETPAQPK